MDIIIKKALNTYNLKHNEITQLLKSDDTDLYKAADYVCKSHKKNIVHLRGLIEYTNICKCSCYYCGLRCENKKVKRYRLTDEQILSCCKKAVKLGYRTIVLQGGEDGGPGGGAWPAGREDREAVRSLRRAHRRGQGLLGRPAQHRGHSKRRVRRWRGCGLTGEPEGGCRGALHPPKGI